MKSYAQKQFHGAHRKHSYFEGWYLKHQTDSTSISLIPAFHRDKNGSPSVSIQIISPDYQGCAWFSADQFQVSEDTFDVQIAENHFSEHGIDLNLSIDSCSIRGHLSYEPFTRLHKHIMGPFQYLNFMQCNHGILSLSHTLQGTLEINGSAVDFSGGTGYIEKDWGSSFPQSYLWTQGSFTSPSGSPGCIFLSIAHIPMLGFSFTGCIGIVFYEGKEYRFATYHKASVLHWGPDGASVSQGRWKLHVTRTGNDQSRPLHAPQHGDMSRTVYESIAEPVHYQFLIDEIPLLDLTVPNASFEYGTNDAG